MIDFAEIHRLNAGTVLSIRRAMGRPEHRGGIGLIVRHSCYASILDLGELAMARARKVHIQLAITFKKRGGARKGAGRPPKGPRSSERHKKRPYHRARYPLHVTIRVADDIPYLRQPKLWKAVREATRTHLARDHFRIVHMSVQSNHIHLIVEAASKELLAKGMQGFEISAAKHINRVIAELTGKRRKGTVFPDRYHARELTTPREVHKAINYVLNNFRRHHEDRVGPARTWLLDRYSNAIAFGGWKELGAGARFTAPADYEALFTCAPQTWLLRIGWQKYPPISVYDRPGRAAN
ncbi:MAG TPA: transposase [Kofleriaceae bacterium]|nr:transposase [Kofleriaceae bacterium]